MKFLLIFLLVTAHIFSQTFTIEGIVQDAESGEPLSSANIIIEELERGAISDNEGKFKIDKIIAGHYSLKVSFIGYEIKNINIEIIDNKSFLISLNKLPIQLGTTVITGTRPNFRETPIAFSTLSRDEVKNKSGGREAVNILENLPSTFISNRGGGIGEQRLSLRGFDQQNISVMINGIPINNPENGEVYWSNWSGISDIVHLIAVQRGLSAVPYSNSSIGGTVNFVTANFINTENRYNLGFEYGPYNLKKSSFNFSNQLSNNVSISALISKRNLDGFADQVYSNELTYFLSFNLLLKKHSLNFQIFGSPQKHGQRLIPQKIKTWDKLGKMYNPDWGYLNGKPLSLRDNEFHNPTLSISHNWQLRNALILSNIVSLSRGYGGGTVPPWYPELTRTENGLINFDREYRTNINNIDETFSNTRKRSIIALRKGVHENVWGNLISEIKYSWSNFKFSFGLDGKLYNAKNYNELSNLLGGDYYIGSGNLNLDPNTILVKGDKVDFFAESFTRRLGLFFQTEYQNQVITTYLNLSVSNTQYNRVDYFNYLYNDPKRETGWKSFLGYNLKWGLNFNLDSFNNIYLNVGKISRAPLSMNVYDYGNNLYENVKNENILSFEIGYGFKNKFANFNLNLYLTNWQDKSFSNNFLNSDSTAIYYYNIFGASASHNGIEFEGNLKIFDNLSLSSMLSYAVNKWTSDIDAFVRPESSPTDEIRYHAFTKNLYVGNNPMTSASFGILSQGKLFDQVEYFINPVYSFFGSYYAQFYPELRTNPSTKGIQPWRIPDFHNVNIYSQLKFNIIDHFINSVNISFNIYNIFDSENIIEAIDGSTHDANSALVWYSIGRWWNVRINVEF